MIVRRAALIFILAFILSACGQDEETPPPPPTWTSEAIPYPTSTLEAKQPAATATVPTVVPKTPAPTVTLEPPVTITPLPTSTPVKVNLKTAADFGTTYNPLTGERVGDDVQLNRRPLAVKISNAPARWVRPQSGLNDADLVFEHITEAGITRFTLIVYGRSPTRVGPIRSARLIDLELPAMYDAALVYSGSSEGVREQLLDADFRPRILFSFESGYFRSGEEKPLEHTLYALPDELRETLDAKGLNETPVFNALMSFNSDPPAGGQPAAEVTIDYDWTLIDWIYDEDIGRYLRWTDEEPHLDGSIDEQVSAANIIVLFADHVQVPEICEQVINGICTAFSVEIDLMGSGPATLFRDGLQYDGFWERNSRRDMLNFKGENGDSIPLQVGSSWIQIIPNWYDNPVTVGQ